MIDALTYTYNSDKVIIMYACKTTEFVVVAAGMVMVRLVISKADKQSMLLHKNIPLPFYSSNHPLNAIFSKLSLEQSCVELCQSTPIDFSGLRLE